MIGCPYPGKVTMPPGRFFSLNNEWIARCIAQINCVCEERGWNKYDGGKRIHLLKPTILFTLCCEPEAPHVHDEKRDAQQDTCRTSEHRQTTDTPCKPPIERFSAA